jgi:molybdopterin-binding protein
VITTESLEDMDLAVGDEVRLVVKAVNVLPVKE